jgi:hypothetical protein
MDSCHVLLFYAILRKNSTFIYIYMITQQFRESIKQLRIAADAKRGTRSNTYKPVISVAKCKSKYLTEKGKHILYHKHIYTKQVNKSKGWNKRTKKKKIALMQTAVESW